jgi:hypothetical protein
MALGRRRSTATHAARWSGRANEGVRDRREADGTQRCASDVEPSGGLIILALRHMPKRHRGHEYGERQVDEKQPAPPGSADEPAADERPGGRRHPGEAGPQADGSRPVVGVKRCLDDRERAGREHGAADALHHAARDQPGGVWRDRAQQRRQCEPDDSDDEDPATAVPVSERAAHQDECGQGQRVPVHRPLQTRERGAQLRPDRRQRDVDHGGVEEGHAGAKNGGDHYPPAGPAG